MITEPIASGNASDSKFIRWGTDRLHDATVPVVTVAFANISLLTGKRLARPKACMRALVEAYVGNQFAGNQICKTLNSLSAN
jgi:hypothetical protein